MNYVRIEYFRDILEKYLDEKHPELPDREEQVERRSKQALQTYHELAKKGVDHQTALEIACLELNDGFGFPLFEYLYDLVFDDFEEIPDEIRRDFCIVILPECQQVRESLTYDGMDESEAYYYFESKMAEIIQKRIDEDYNKMFDGIAGNIPT